MHILVINDDGPPSQSASPYIHTFVRQLQANGHVVSVVLPTEQRSWIGKAHFVDKTLSQTYFTPGELSYTEDTGTVSDFPAPADSTAEEWLLVDGTPASCAQVGLHHHFQARGPIDLVVAGPNYGRNSTAVFALSSGTIGGALEAAICGHRAIALSYAYFERESAHEPEAIQAATKISVRVIEEVMKPGKWPGNATVLSVNVPLQVGVANTKVFWTKMMENTWVKGSSQYKEEAVPVDGSGSSSGLQNHTTATATTDVNGNKDEAPKHHRFAHKQLLWSPNVQEVLGAAKGSVPGLDGWTVNAGYVSVTPLRASFMNEPQPLEELEFSS